MSEKAPGINLEDEPSTYVEDISKAEIMAYAAAPHELAARGILRQIDNLDDMLDSDGESGEEGGVTYGELDYLEQAYRAEKRKAEEASEKAVASTVPVSERDPHTIPYYTIVDYYRRRGMSSDEIRYTLAMNQGLAVGTEAYDKLMKELNEVL
jgi:hypothetical protein